MTTALDLYGPPRCLSCGKAHTERTILGESRWDCWNCRSRDALFTIKMRREMRRSALRALGISKRHWREMRLDHRRTAVETAISDLLALLPPVQTLAVGIAAHNEWANWYDPD